MASYHVAKALAGVGRQQSTRTPGTRRLKFREVSDLLHLLDAVGADAEYTVERGRRYHEGEVDEEQLDEDEVLRKLIGA